MTSNPDSVLARNIPAPLGEILKQKGILTQAQIDEVLAVQKRSSERRLFGQILISRGLATKPQIDVALARQKETQGQKKTVL